MTIQIIYNEYPLNYDSQAGSFTVGNIVYGATSGAYGTIRRIDRTGGTTGTLYLESISGTFQDNEIIYEATYGSEMVSTQTDRDFSVDEGNWTGATISHDAVNEELDVTATAAYNGASLPSSAMSSAYISSYFYKLGYKIANLSAGGILVSDADLIARNYETNVQDGTHTTIMQAAASEGGIAFRNATEGATWSIDDISIKQITNAALANGTVQSPITIDLELTRQGVQKTFVHESSLDRSYSGKVQIINQYGIQEMSFEAMFSMTNYYKLLAWWSWARQGKLWAFTMDSTKTGNTTLDGGAASGQKVIPLIATTAFTAADICLLKREDLDDSYEVIVIASVSAGVSVTAVDNLKFNYASGDSFKHFDYWPELVTLDNKFSPTRTGVNSTSGKYWRHTFKFTEAL